jgi:CheY-like chemotaxis protein
MAKAGPILILEDDEDDQEFFSDCFEALQTKNEIIYFKKAQPALDYLRTTRDQPFIIISDINLPIMNGLEFRQLINDDEFLRKKSIPFIFYSTSASPAAVDQAYDLTVQGFFIKDHSIENFHETMSLILKYWERCRHPNSK